MLHRLIYPIVLLGVIHYLWRVKKDMTEPLIFAAALALLLAMRLPWASRCCRLSAIVSIKRGQVARLQQ